VEDRRIDGKMMLWQTWGFKMSKIGETASRIGRNGRI
jgi:hypothetical protein